MTLAVNWYPRICVYDRKFTWETDQHVEKEFYGDYGAFDVELDLPNHYIVEATGLLQNKAEAMPTGLRKQIDISNFKETPIGSQPSVIIPATGKRKRWQFHANNVHDFDWTADPTYRIGEVEWTGVKCVAIARWVESFMAILESEAQGKHPAPDSGLDGPQGLASSLRDFLLGASTIECHFDGRALSLGQRTQSRSQTAGVLIGL